MQRPGTTTGKFLAFAAMAMMLTVQWFHSPLQHLGCSNRSTCCTETGTSNEAQHSHQHVAADGSVHTHVHSGHQHAHTDAEAASNCSDSKTGEPCPCDDEQCQLCEFLGQPCEPLTLPDFELSAEIAEILTQVALSQWTECERVGPFVRGPPVA